MSIVTRFAPSPTGLLHVGNYRTAVFAYLFARHMKGTFILRIEDTDRQRSKKEYEENIMESLKWLGLEHDALYRQSEETERHEVILKKLVDEGKAYVSKETPKEEGERSEVIRFKNPNKKVVFKDLIRGEVAMDTTDLGDFVIAKSFTEPIFHLVNVADDIEEGVTHVIRGEDHLSNTPRQILLFEALEKPHPEYAHIPLVLAPDRTKLSKRKGARPLLEYRDLGYLPDALLNYLALVGWNPGTEEELFTKEKLIQTFTLEQVHKSGGIFDETKLKWVNREHLLKLTPEEFGREARGYLSSETLKVLDEMNVFERIVPLMRERVHTLSELKEMDEKGEWRYFGDLPAYSAEKLIPLKSAAADGPATGNRLNAVLTALEALPESQWSAEKIKEVVFPYAEQEGRGNVLWPMRYALSGMDKSPDPFTIAGIIGKDETKKRLTRGIEALR